jgi:hypothetical protein
VPTTTQQLHPAAVDDDARGLRGEHRGGPAGRRPCGRRYRRCLPTSTADAEHYATRRGSLTAAITVSSLAELARSGSDTAAS